MNQNEREQFFTDQISPGDFETVAGYTRNRGRMMTAQYLNEVVDKRNGMEVTDKDGDVWGWVYDCHKDIGKWITGGTHDERVKLMAKGFGEKELRPIYEPYHYTQGEYSVHTPASFSEGMEAHISDPVNPDHYQGFSNGAKVIYIAENLTFNAGNAVKYLSRAGRIDGRNKGSILEDLQKAAWYVAREIGRIEGES